MTVALPASLFLRARADTTMAPSMPMNDHIMMIRQFTIWSPTPPRSTPSPAMAAALLAICPQKSAVNTPALNSTMLNRMNTTMGTTFAIMTMALRNAALSTPRMTRNVMPHMMTLATTMLPMLLPGRKYGRKNPSVDMRMVANATLPSHADSQ